MRWAAFLAGAIAAAAQGQTIVWYKFDPAAIRSDRTTPAVFDVQTSGAISSVALDYAGGGRLTLAPNGANRWTGTVNAARLLFNYTTASVNHNFVAFVRLVGSGGPGDVLATYNGFINVVDANVPGVQVKDLGSGARASTRILNLYRPALSTADVQAIAQQFYTFYRDDYDFLDIVFSEPSYPANRYHFATRNDVTGIGLTIQNNTAAYGSAGKLMGISVFPIDTYFDAGESAFVHELGHQWINFLKNPGLMPGPHWPPSTMARGIMGWNIPPTNEGGDFPWDIVPVTGTTARTTSGQSTKGFDDFDLYLMGLLPASAVAPGLILQQPPCANCVIGTTTISINDVIQSNGPRVPAAGTAKSSFRVATVVISRDRPLNDEEMAVLEYFAARGEALDSLPYTAGFAKGTSKPFNPATRGLGHLDFRLVLPLPRHRGVRH